MNVKIQSLEISKSLKDINPSFRKKLFNKRKQCKHKKKCPDNLYTKFRNVWK